MRLRAAVLALAAALALLVLSACGGGDSGSSTTSAEAPVIRIGTKNFSEQYILGELYSQALKAKGFKVQLKSDIGASEIIDQALLGGGIDMYPEYVGVLLSEIANERMRPKDVGEAYAMAKAFETRRGFTLLEATPFTDSNALAVKPATARRDGIKAIGDLKKLGSDATIGAPPEFRTRFEGLVGLKSLYGLKQVKTKALPIGEQYAALDNGSVNAAAVFTTDGQLAGGRYLILDDGQSLFAGQHVAPVISQKLVKAGGPKLVAAINAVSRKLTTDAMRKMNAAVQLRKESPAAVARRFLAEQQLG